jgi:hypothetical protein
MSDLNKALRDEAAPTSPLWPLPLAHLTAVRWLGSISRIGELHPTSCRVFNREILYLSYGGVFYRPDRLQTENPTELPIAFLFDPSLLDRVHEAYPFDTGAVASSLFGEPWTSVLREFEHFAIWPLHDSSLISLIPKLVYHVFGCNKNYLRGNPSETCKLGNDPFPFLYDFLSADMSELRVDHRQRTIECLINRRLQLDETLIWIGYPDRCSAEIISLLEKYTLPRVPQLYHILIRAISILQRLAVGWRGKRNGRLFRDTRIYDCKRLKSV